MIFTDEQKRIFEFVEKGTGHGIIDAVAGAGKTTTIMQCARFVKDQKATLFCAFNNSIASEISRKFHNLGFYDVTVKTIHALGRQILQDNNHSGPPIKLIADKYKVLLEEKGIQKKLKPHLDRLLRINGFGIGSDDKSSFAAKNLLEKISFRLVEINQKFRATLAKEGIEEFESLVIHFGIFNDVEIAKANFKEEINEYFKAHRILLDEGNDLAKRAMVIDYTDMLYLPYTWQQEPVKKYEFLFIDECQDLSKSQFAIATKYGNKEGRMLAVGDPGQSIYGFTGADINSFDRIRDYTKATQLSLTNCFRCPRKIVELARSIRQDMIGIKQEDGIVSSVHFNEVVELAIPGDLIISRLRATIVLLVFDFIDKNIKVKIHEEEQKEIINEIKNIFKQNELQRRIATFRGGFPGLKSEVKKRWKWIIQKNAERIRDGKERKIFIKSEEKFLEKKLEFLHKKHEKWKNECGNVNDMLHRIKEYISEPHNPIRLSTIHRAKGLENERVFILNYDELPFHRTQMKDWERTQELNLKYVAITRALKELYLIENKKLELIEEEGSLFDNMPFN